MDDGGFTYLETEDPEVTLVEYLGIGEEEQLEDGSGITQVYFGSEIGVDDDAKIIKSQLVANHTDLLGANMQSYHCHNDRPETG